MTAAEGAGDAHVPLRVPVGSDAERWVTFRGERTLVAAARTLTSAVRLLETLPPLLHDDDRVTVVFAYDPTSAFGGGVLDVLGRAGCRVVPWPQLKDLRPDLIVSASENLDLPEGTCPVLVLPHGVGFHKQVPDARGAGTRVSGVVPAAWLRSGRAWMAISHPAQREQLRRAAPQALGRTILVGDPIFDDLSASLPQGAEHRRSLGVSPGERLVVISSTWGGTSLLGRDPHLPARILAELPYDAYRVAAIVHPNVWSGHGSWHLRVLQSAALDAGLLLMPPAHAWRSAVVAADVVVGDHGSVTLYGAALGKPTLLATFGDDAVPGTAADHLGRSAPRLAPPGRRHQQIAAAVHRHDDGEAPAPTSLAAQAFAEAGQASARLRTALYDLLNLPEPPHLPPSPTALPSAGVRARRVTSWLVVAAVGGASDQPVVTVTRHPAAVAEPIPEKPPSFVHLACAEDERDPQLLESASVLIRRTPAESEVSALRWLTDALRRLPGSRLSAVPLGPRRFLTRMRDSRVVEATVTGPPVDAGLPAAVVYACLRAGVTLDGTFAVLRVDGLGERDVALRLRHGAAPPG